MKKFIFFICIITLYSFNLAAQSNQISHHQWSWWLSLEQGKNYFRSGSYGNALLAFEDARRARWQRFTRMENDLIAALSTAEFRRLGDSLDLVEEFTVLLRYDNAASALNELYFHIPKHGLDNSVNRALDEINRLKSYPEAEFWLGETYRAEGELGLALRQYQIAYDQRALLEIPSFAIEILYKMVDLHRIRQEYQEMENRALQILRSPEWDSLWAGGTDSYGRPAMMRILENDGINRFLTIYRYNNAQIERAHRFLGLYYYASARNTQAVEHLMFAFLIQNTLLIEHVLRTQFDYTFTDLNSLMDALSRRRDLQDFLDQTEYFRTAYYFGASLFANGRRQTADQLWTFLASRPEAGEWRVRSLRQLQNPFVDTAQAMP